MRTSATRIVPWIVALTLCGCPRGPAGEAAPPAGSEVRRPMTDAEIVTAVQSELLTDSGVPSFRLDVAAEEGVVTLTGELGDLATRDRAVRLAQTVRGVRSVVDRVSIRDPGVSDALLERMVELALEYDPATDLHELEVDADHGVVHLRGTVDSWHERELVRLTAAGVVGVRAVEDHVALDLTAERGDAEIVADVEGLVEADVLLQPHQLDVACEDGEVTVTGSVGSAAQRRRVEQRAWVSGTRSVDVSGVRVLEWLDDEWQRDTLHPLVPDATIEEALSDALHVDPRVSRLDIEVAVDHGTVTLDGVVDHLEARRAAEQTARNTRGVWSVRNLLRVVPPAQRSDEELAAAVRQALLRDPLVEGRPIEVEVEEGVVTLGGTVDSRYERARADDVAARCAGVLHVRNRLGVADAERPMPSDPLVEGGWTIHRYEWWHEPDPGAARLPDHEIARRVREELRWNPLVDELAIAVAVDDGVVQLTGTVDDHVQRAVASAEAYEAGAAYVDNDLQAWFAADDPPP